jgi:hypothetical protein
MYPKSLVKRDAKPDDARLALHCGHTREDKTKVLPWKSFPSFYGASEENPSILPPIRFRSRNAFQLPTSGRNGFRRVRFPCYAIHHRFVKFQNAFRQSTALVD